LVPPEGDLEASGCSPLDCLSDQEVPQPRKIGEGEHPT
jgi:hypothetical protein